MQAKAVYLHPKEFSIEAGELTPTQKLVRRKIEVLFATQIEEMYKSLPWLYFSVVCIYCHNLAYAHL